MTLALTPTRLSWLQALAKHGEMPWAKLPRSSHGRHVNNRTWRPMVDAGWITARFAQRHWTENMDWNFTITDAGRAVLRSTDDPTPTTGAPS